MSSFKSIQAYIPFVKEQVGHQEKQADRATSRGDEKRAQAYRSRAAMFRQLADDLESCSEGPATPLPPANLEASLRLTPDDLRDLPPELMEQLSFSESDKRDFLIMDLIDGLGGIASLDQILVAIYRKTGEVEKRNKLNARLYRMASKGSIFPYPEKKGVYTTKPVADTGAGTTEGSADDEDLLLTDPEDDQPSLV
ncbi:hypothetical protein [Cupriavidus pauculus]|uniref:hypothetical protein n=1 Tax=Cupriavidus pauculus TaxID=82633 RepID=UPI0007862C3D|nr:hypothetical protein [Cupriavidus pauculus]